MNTSSSTHVKGLQEALKSAKAYSAALVQCSLQEIKKQIVGACLHVDNKINETLAAAEQLTVLLPTPVVTRINKPVTLPQTSQVPASRVPEKIHQKNKKAPPVRLSRLFPNDTIVICASRKTDITPASPTAAVYGDQLRYQGLLGWMSPLAERLLGLKSAQGPNYWWYNDNGIYKNMTQLNEERNYAGSLDIPDNEEPLMVYLVQPDRLHTHVRKAEMACYRSHGRFLLKAGAIVSTNDSKKLRHQEIKSLRRKAHKTGVLRDNGNRTSTLLKDILFNTQSAAASFVTGTSSDGNSVWKTIDGIKYGEICNPHKSPQIVPEPERLFQ
jgi:hypothetical protein